MRIPVVLRDGKEHSVDKNRFQFLLTSKQIVFFKRAEGWVVVGRDHLRDKTMPYRGKERRNLELYSKNHWY
jgi:hypothetical protein